MEKPLARAAGLGWQGKHTNLVSREFGSWLFLGAIFSASELPHDEADIDHCGSCNACQEICPTAAFPAPYKLDARRCISYLTIENKGPIPHEFRKSIGNRIYGCDDCLAVCPWNKFAQAGPRSQTRRAGGIARAVIAELVRLDDAAFRALFSKSPVKRIGRDRFIRNVLIAIGNADERRWRPRPNVCWMTQARWCAARRLGVVAVGGAGEVLARWQRRRWAARRMRACARSGGKPVHCHALVRGARRISKYCQRGRHGSRRRSACSTVRIRGGLDFAHRNPPWSSAMTKNQPFFTHDRDSDSFMPTPVSQRPVGPQFAARPRRDRPARPCRSSSATAPTISCRRG